MGDTVRGAAVSHERDQFGKKRNGKPRKMVLPDGVSLIPVGGRFELSVDRAPVGLFDSTSAAIAHLVETGRMVLPVEKVARERSRAQRDYEYVQRREGGIDLYCDEEFEGFFPDRVAALKYVRELARQRQKETTRRAGTLRA